MEFTPRNRDILQLMLTSSQPLTKQEIADRIGVSKRTTQREFEYIEEALKEYRLQVVNRKGQGTVIQGREEDKQLLLQDLSATPVIGAEGKEERCRTILFHLLKDRTPKKVYYFSNLLGVSEATAAHDMEQLRPWLEHFHLTLIKRPGYGVTVDGSEKDFRQAMRRFISESGSADLFTDRENAAISDAVFDSIHKKSIYSLLKQDTVDRVRHVLNELQDPQIMQLADYAYMGLIVHISIAVERIKAGSPLGSAPSDLGDTEHWKEYDTACLILDRIEHEFDIEMPEGEIAYLLLHLRASKSAYSVSVEKQEERERKDLMDLLDRMIDAYDTELAVELKADEEFLDGLVMHLEPVIVRLKNGLDIYNPLLEEMKQEYPDVFSKCRRVAGVLKEEIGSPVSDEEIGFLAMHFGAAQEKHQKQRRSARKVRIGVVCASGFGLAKLMEARLVEHLKDSATIQTYGRGEITPYVAGKNDFFVSTFDLGEEKVDFLRTSPLITRGDLEQIQAKIREYAYIPRAEENLDFEQQLEEANFVTKEIKGLLNRYRHFSCASNMTLEDVIRFLSLEVSSNLQDARTIQRDLLRREGIGSQIVPELHLALLHSFTKGVRESMIHTVTPGGENGFTDDALKEVDVVVMILLPHDIHRREHQEVAGRISSAFVKDERFLNTFRSGDEAEIRAALKETLRDYFYEVLDQLSRGQ